MSAKDEAGKVFVEAGAGVGGAVGGAVVGAAVSNVATASAATTAWAAGATGPFSGFSYVIFHPAAWAVVISSPVGTAITICGLTGIGAFTAYKLARRVLN